MGNPTSANLKTALANFQGNGKSVIDTLFPVVCKNSDLNTLLHFTELLVKEGKFLEAGYFANILGAALPTDVSICRLLVAIAAGKSDFAMARGAQVRAESLKAPDEVLMVTGVIMLLLGGHRDMARLYANEMLDRVGDDWLCFDVAIDAALQMADSELLIRTILHGKSEPHLGQRQMQQALTLLRTRLINLLRATRK